MTPLGHRPWGPVPRLQENRWKVQTFHRDALPRGSTGSGLTMSIPSCLPELQEGTNFLGRLLHRPRRSRSGGGAGTRPDGRCCGFELRDRAAHPRVRQALGRTVRRCRPGDDLLRGLSITDRSGAACLPRPTGTLVEVRTVSAAPGPGQPALPVEGTIPLTGRARRAWPVHDSHNLPG